MNFISCYPPLLYRHLEVPLLAVKMRIVGCNSSKHETSVATVLYHWLYTPETRRLNCWVGNLKLHLTQLRAQKPTHSLTTKETYLTAKLHLWTSYLLVFRSQWPRGLGRKSTAARLLRSWVRIPPEAWMFVWCVCCELSGRGLCDELITRPEASYRLWRDVVWSGNLENEEAIARAGLQSQRISASSLLQILDIYFNDLLSQPAY
jgi:hypothetical protein